MPNALILIAEETEEVELYGLRSLVQAHLLILTHSNTTFTTLVRAGIPCTSAYVAEDPAKHDPTTARPPLARCSEGIHILPDTFFSTETCTPDKYDLLVVPGGTKSSEVMSASAGVQQTVRDFLEAGRVVGMICAGGCCARLYGLCADV